MRFLAGETAIVTGAARGLGRAFAEALAAEGAGLVLCNLQVERPEQIARVLVELLRAGPDGRSGENIGLWLGHPVELPPR